MICQESPLLAAYCVPFASSSSPDLGALHFCIATPQCPEVSMTSAVVQALTLSPWAGHCVSRTIWFFGFFPALNGPPWGSGGCLPQRPLAPALRPHLLPLPSPNS